MPSGDAQSVAADLLTEVAVALLACRDFDEASCIVLEGALRMTESPAGLAGYLDPETGSLLCRTAGTGDSGFTNLSGWFPGDQPEPVIQNGSAESPAGFARFLSVPVRSGQRRVGQIGLANAPADYSGDHLMWLERLAALYGGTVERIRHDGAMRESHDRLQAAFEAAPVGIAALDLEGRVTMWNAGAERIFGWKEQEVLGRVPPTIPEDRLEEVNAAYRDLLAHGKHVDYELRRHRKDGRAVDLAVSMAPLTDGHGHLTGTVAVYSDVTARKEADQLLVRANQELSRSNAELEQFAYVASHDLQEPLRMIKGYLQLIQRRYKGKLDSEADEFIVFAVDGATRMKSLIDALLEYSRIGSRGREFAHCQSGEALDRALANLQAAVEDSGAEIVRGALPEITADVVQLTQVFQNLIGNGLKFRGARKPRIEICADRCEGDWLFRVRDNGIGIPPEHRDRIFEIFQRLHSREEYDGTGIGLAITKRIVERHGGRVWAESTPGEGSTFLFTIPDRE